MEDVSQNGIDDTLLVANKEVIDLNNRRDPSETPSPLPFDH